MCDAPAIEEQQQVLNQYREAGLLTEDEFLRASAELSMSMFDASSLLGMKISGTGGNSGGMSGVFGRTQGKPKKVTKLPPGSEPKTRHSAQPTSSTPRSTHDESVLSESGVSIISGGQKQGRETRIENLEIFEHDLNQPKWLRGWIKTQREQVQKRGKGTILTPPGMVQAHGRKTPAREGFQYLGNSRLQGEDLNKLEESVRVRYQR